MNKFAIPAILVATVMVAGMFAFAPVEQASTVHGTFQATFDGADDEDLTTMKDAITGHINSATDVTQAQIASLIEIEPSVNLVNAVSTVSPGSVISTVSGGAVGLHIIHFIATDQGSDGALQIFVDGVNTGLTADTRDGETLAFVGTTVSVLDSVNTTGDADLTTEQFIVLSSANPSDVGIP